MTFGKPSSPYQIPKSRDQLCVKRVEYFFMHIQVIKRKYYSE